MPVYPGTRPPIFKAGCTIEKDSFAEKEITMFSHTGTHIDAPAHLLQGRKYLDDFGMNHFFGEAAVIQLDFVKKERIELEDLEDLAPRINGKDFVLLQTGWDRYWGSPYYFSGYPVLSSKAAEWLSSFKIKGLGLDAISVDPTDTMEYEIHRLFLSQDILIIENLSNLSLLGTNPFKFSCFPLKFHSADGSPVRAAAYLD
jgi:kynurenine formamidase